MILTTLSDKALLERARSNDDDATPYVEALLSRWGVAPANPAKTLAKWREPKMISVTAAKRIALAT